MSDEITELDLSPQPSRFTVADLTIYSSYEKSGGFASFEAMACGLCGKRKPLIRVRSGYWQDPDGKRIHWLCTKCLLGAQSSWRFAPVDRVVSDG